MRYALPLIAILAAPAAQAQDWTGGYAGVQLGGINVDTNAGLDETGFNYGVHAGYRYDFGTWTLGGEFDYDFANLELAPGVDVDEVGRLKAAVGFDAGVFLPYITAGAARVDTTLGSEIGYFAGAGLVYQITPQIDLGGEILYHEFDDIDGSGVDAEAVTYMLRASFRF